MGLSSLVVGAPLPHRLPQRRESKRLSQKVRRRRIRRQLPMWLRENQSGHWSPCCRLPLRLRELSPRRQPSMNVVSLRAHRPMTGGIHAYALVDSGATHALRRASSQEEWEQADPVIANLAGGESVALRINRAGTILVPVTSDHPAMSTTSIVRGSVLSFCKTLYARYSHVFSFCFPGRYLCGNLFYFLSSLIHLSPIC